MFRVNRTLVGNGRYRRLATFAADFGRVSTSSLSRWEAGLTTMPRWAARRYERLLGLPDGLLQVTADTVARYHSPPGTPTSDWIREEQVPAQLDLLDRATGDGELSGADWYRLSGWIASEPHLVLCPNSTWTRLAERLLVEISIADGLAWMSRAEAYHRLIAHPVGQAPAIATAVAAAADQSAQSMIGSLSVFAASGHRDASRAVLDQIVDPTSSRTFYGALLTSAKKLRYGHFTDQHIGALLPVLIELLGYGSWERISLAARLLRSLPPAARRRLPPRVRVLLDQVSAVDTARTPLPPTDDPALPLVVAEMIDDPVFDVRLSAAFQIYSTPYRATVSQTLGEELLAEWRRRGDLDRMERILESLRVLGGPAQRRLVERMLLGRDTSPAVRDMAAYALGHIGGTSTDAFLLAVIDAALRRWARDRDPHDASVLDRVVYAIGMSRRPDLLPRVLAEPDLPAPVRTAARWWLNLPDHLTRSASG